MLKHLLPNAVNTLLQALNNIWFAFNFPPSWRASTLIPIPKPAKDASDPNNYRLIALTSCLCKIYSSSLWFSQTKQHYRPPRTFRIFLQRKLYSTATCLCRIFWLQKGLRLYWIYGIMKDHEAGRRGRLPCFIEGFLKIDSFQSA